LINKLRHRATLLWDLSLKGKNVLFTLVCEPGKLRLHLLHASKTYSTHDLGENALEHT